VAKAIQVTRAYAVGLSVRRRLFWGDVALSLRRIDDANDAPVEIVQVATGWYAEQLGDLWRVLIAESDEVTRDQIARAQRLAWGEIEIEVAQRQEPRSQSKRIWSLTGTVVRRTGEQP